MSFFFTWRISRHNSSYLLSQKSFNWKLTQIQAHGFCGTPYRVFAQLPEAKCYRLDIVRAQSLNWVLLPVDPPTMLLFISCIARFNCPQPLLTILASTNVNFGPRRWVGRAHDLKMTIFSESARWNLKSIFSLLHVWKFY